ncbi:NB-ARC domains-containing protein [Artemisia annua]|uniref:NB-ARC domains-containing protein n=1 Tax=Artemisia annua TaxID=35608 RepID=A0A2U1QKF4_ARTAN|nr:NB-ARC domains-containing protein [Artemisia annua]
MAAAVLIEAGVGEVLSKLTDAIIYVIKKTSQFKSILRDLQETLTRLKPFFHDIDKLIEQLDRPQHEKDMFIAQIKGAEAIVRKCERVKWNYYKKYKHACKLDKLNVSLLRFFQIDVQLVIVRGVLDLQVAKDAEKRMMEGDKRDRVSSVPLVKGKVIGFNEQLRTLKAMVLKGSTVDDCSVVVVSAGGGCGKTTLVTLLCSDLDIQGKFGKENIYFATISETPNLKIVIKDLLQNNQGGPQDFVNDDEAINKWGRFLVNSKAGALLVLDDVWSDTIIKRFKFNLRGYTILVTSRSTYKQFETYQLQHLSDEDSTNLFCHSAFSEVGSEHANIPDDLVEKLVKCGKNHPLALSVIGGLLKGTDIESWHHMSENLSQRKQSVFDLNEDMLLCLSRSLDELKEPEIMKCYLDMGLFPEDQKIAATMLMDMWVHLYRHDEEGLATINHLLKLFYKNLATLLPIRKSSPVIANYCEEKVVMQHDLMRTLAIRLSSKEPEEERERLIIKPDGQDLPKVPQAVNARLLSISARLLSISTGENFSVEWNDMQASKVEVLVMNFLSKTHPLPQFIRYIEKLKILIITNYGYYFSKIENFPPPLYLSSLTSIRLDHVSISSISTSILELKNLQKLSLIMCKIGESFSKCTDGIPNKLPSLVELHIDSCDDLVTFPVMLCNLLLLRKLCIINCHELTLLSEEFGNFPNLDVLRLASCSNLIALPKTIRNLQKLSIIDISDCINLSELPLEFGELGSLQTIYMRGCTGLHELPSSVKGPLEVVCDYETSLLWNNIPDVKLQLEEEDKIVNWKCFVLKLYICCWRKQRKQSNPKAFWSIHNIEKELKTSFRQNKDLVAKLINGLVP